MRKRREAEGTEHTKTETYGENERRDRPLTLAGR